MAKKILFVEDDAVISRLYCKKLESWGFEVRLAEDGLEATRELMAFQPDLVVLDLMLPKLNGVDVLRFMRQQPALQSTATVVFSNALLTELGEQIAGLGVEATMAKSNASPALLAETVAKILGTTVDEEQPAAPQEPDGTDATTLVAARPPTKEESKARAQREFLNQTEILAVQLDKLCRDFVEARDCIAQFRRIETFRARVSHITHLAAMAKCYRTARLSSAIEALLFKLQENPACINTSSKNTLSSTIAFMNECLRRADTEDEQELAPTAVLIVDDDAVSNLALTYSLSRVNAMAGAVTDPRTALATLEQTAYDVILLDVQLPEMNGIVLYQELRRIPHHVETPVIFITGHPEYEQHARAVMQPNDDWITKPVLPVELSVKVVTYALKRRLTGEPTSGQTAAA